MGLAPGLMPGRVALEQSRPYYLDAWGDAPEKTGMDLTQILQAAKEGKIHALILRGIDPIADFPDQKLAKEALGAVGFFVAVGAFKTDSNKHADVILPPTVWGEKSGTTTNLEGRVQTVAKKVTAAGSAMPDWRIAQELAKIWGNNFGYESETDITDDIARVAPAYASIDRQLLAVARDGVVVPAAENKDDIVYGPAQGLSDYSWEPIRPTALGQFEPPNIQAPSMEPVRWVGETQFSVPARDQYALRLISSRFLHDAGRMVSNTPALALLARGAALRINGKNADQIGVSDGAEVKVTTPRASFTVPVEIDARVQPDTAMLAFAQPGAHRANELIDVGSAVTDIRVELL